MMKKMLLAMALTSLITVNSALALTFTDGNFSGTVNISGTITVPVATNYWQWATGSDLIFNNTVGMMTNNSKTLTIAMTTDAPLLVVQTKQATVAATVGAGIIPQVQFANATGTVIHPVWSSSGNTGKGAITLPVTNGDGTVSLGSATLNVKAGGAYLSQALSPVDSTLMAISAVNIGSNTSFGNGVPDSITGALVKGTQAISWANTLGATKTQADLITDLKVLTATTKTTFDSDTASSGGFSTPGYANNGVYGLGIANGDSIVVNFTNAINTTTTWKAPLNLTISYL